MKTFLYNKQDTQNLEKKLEKNAIPNFLLMMRAGHNLYQIIKKNFVYDEIITIAGPGNNGGDAIAFAIQANLNNEKVHLITLSKKKQNSKILFDLAIKIGIKKKTISPKLFNSKKILIVDGILGIGISRKPSGLILKTIKFINSYKKRNLKIVSIDVPSGLNPNTGVAYSETILADSTIMCLTRKQGCYTGDGLRYSGKLFFTDLGITNADKIQKTCCILLDEKCKFSLKRNNNYHKGKFGNVLILGGWDNMPGAANLSALSALKTGCGKVFLCTNNLNNLPNEVIQVFPALNSVKKVIEKINVVIAGPGLGNKGSEILSFLWKENIPLILDADGINWLASNFLKKRKSLLIGTPHYGEARNLLGREFKNRFKALENIKNKYGGNWVLKGPGTLIKNNNNIYINNFSNSILATAGTGDILAGIIGGLVAQKVKEAEINGVLIHTAAAKALLNEGKKTIIASDLLAEINSSFTLS